MLELDFLNELNEAVVITNTCADIVFCNRRAESITGRQAKKLINQRVEVKLPEIGPDIIEVLKTGRPKCQIMRKLNNHMVNASFFPLYKENTLNGAAAVIQDVSQLESLMVENSRIKAQNKELEDIMESFYDGIGIIDSEGTLLRVNKSYERITGLSRKNNNVGRNVRDLQEEGTVSRAVALMVIEQKKPVTIVQRIRTGKEILITGSPVLDKKGNVSRVVCNIRDLNELNILKELDECEQNRDKLELKELRAKQLLHGELVYKSRAMQHIFELALKVAKVDSNVLITGESGVGKEIIVKIIHKASPRARKSFFQINCGAIPETLLESELFGYEGGAFTGARSGGKMGYFELCNGGTLLLDEIGEMPLNLQVKLLRAIQERQIFRIGGTTPIKFDVRIISATNRDLGEMVKNGLFRADLFYRLNVVPINIPPLRERTDDIIPLAIHFLEKFNAKYKTNKRFEPDVLLAFELYNWPGNVREMENVIERLIIINDEEIIGLHHLPFNNEGVDTSGFSIDLKNPIPLRTASEILERKLIAKALQLFGSTRKAAKILGVSHPTVIRKAQKYNL
ncbi:MAG: sigma 54-interacting transcriptional regulator [Peptococcaceae bacterium]|nr:sigma 54-interacting transcriptional regulator [Peptococcaceae bacterium]